MIICIMMIMIICLMMIMIICIMMIIINQHWLQAHDDDNGPTNATSRLGWSSLWSLLVPWWMIMMNNNDHQGQHHHHSHHDHDEDIPGKVEVASVRDRCQSLAKPSENHIWWQPFRNYFKHIFSALFWTYIFTIFLKHNIDWYLPEQGCCLHLFLTIRNCPFF